MTIVSWLKSRIRPLKFSRDDANSAALEIVWPLPDCSDSFWGGTVEKCDAALAEIRQRRASYKTYEPVWMRREIMRWLAFAERRAKENRKDCLTQKRRNEMDAYSKRQSEKDRRARSVLQYP